MTCLLDTLIPFTAKEPPEGVDLFVCGNADDPENRCYGIMQYFKKGTMLPELFMMKAPVRDERLVDALDNLEYGVLAAPETGFYFPEAADEDYHSLWLRSNINPLDSVYAVINSED